MPEQKLFKLEILTPKGSVFSDKVFHVNAPGKSGRFGVLINHIPSMTLLSTGIVEVQAKAGLLKFDISGGVAEVKNNEMTILTKTATKVDS
jgi:F-type H+-transporting ATPase subunit epsilon